MIYPWLGHFNGQARPCVAALQQQTYRHVQSILRALAVLLAFGFSNSAMAELTVRYHNDGHHAVYENDFTSAAQALQACNAFVAKYNVTCTSGGFPDDKGPYRYMLYEAGWITLSDLDAILVDFFYCEPPYMKAEVGSHKCVDTTPQTASDPKVNGGEPCPCPSPDAPDAPPSVGEMGNPINPATGNKIQRESDIPAHAGRGTLGLNRIYNSSPRGVDGIGPNLFGPLWTTVYEIVSRRVVYES